MFTALFAHFSLTANLDFTQELSAERRPDRNAALGPRGWAAGGGGSDRAGSALSPGRQGRGGEPGCGGRGGRGMRGGGRALRGAHWLVGILRRVYYRALLEEERL